MPSFLLFQNLENQVREYDDKVTYGLGLYTEINMDFDNTFSFVNRFSVSSTLLRKNDRFLQASYEPTFRAFLIDQFFFIDIFPSFAYQYDLKARDFAHDSFVFGMGFALGSQIRLSEVFGLQLSVSYLYPYAWVGEKLPRGTDFGTLSLKLGCVFYLP